MWWLIPTTSTEDRDRRMTMRLRPVYAKEQYFVSKINNKKECQSFNVHNYLSVCLISCFSLNIMPTMSSRMNCISYRTLPILLKIGCISCLSCFFSVLTQLPVLMGKFINEKMGFHLTEFFFFFFNETKQKEKHNTET